MPRSRWLQKGSSRLGRDTASNSPREKPCSLKVAGIPPAGPCCAQPGGEGQGLEVCPLPCTVRGQTWLRRDASSCHFMPSALVRGQQRWCQASLSQLPADWSPASPGDKMCSCF